MQGDSKSPKTENRKKKSIILMIFCILLVIAIVLVLFFFLKEENSNRDTIVTKENVEKIKQQLQEPVEDGYYKTKMTVDWTFENGDAVSSDAYVANSADNTRKVYFDVSLADTQELVYSSPYLPVGTELKDIKLDKSLVAGDYECVLTYHLVDDDADELTTLSVTVNLHILN